MYLVKNAFVQLSRAKGRSFLIGMILFVISVSTCIGLSIRRAADLAKEQSLENMEIKAQISVDRNAMMESMGQPQEGESFDKSSFREKMQEISSLTKEELQTYQQAASVKSFYYTTSVSMNGTDEMEAVSSETSNESETTETTETTEQTGNTPPGDMPQDDGKRGFFKGGMGTQGDFTVVGYSSDEAMTSFLNGTCQISSGEMFSQNNTEMECVISEELASFNDLSIGDTFSLLNPNDDEETSTFTIVGLYSNTQSTVTTEQMGGFSSANDAANQIYTSAENIEAIVAASEEQAEVTTDEETGRETTTALPAQLSGTYTFATVEDYEAFETEARALGLSDEYTISSADITAYEQRLLPLENLEQMALYFLIVVLGIGGIVLVAINIFNIRERKYEIGVLTAIGMKKSKVSLQFLYETLMITAIAVMLGGVAGGVSSVPVTNALLNSQVASIQTEQTNANESFGREFGGPDSAAPGGGGRENRMTSQPATAVEYVTQVTTATDWHVLGKLLGIGFLLTILSSAVSMIFIMRYDPLKILSNRD